MVDFSVAISAIKDGEKVRRKGWNGKGMYIYYVHLPLPFHHDEYESSRGEKVWGSSEFIVMKTADNKLVPWLASQADLLANDWEVL